MSNKNEIYKNLRFLFPVSYKNNKLITYLSTFFKICNKKISNNYSTRLSGDYGKIFYDKLIEKYSKIPLECKNPLLITKNIVADLFSGIPRWRSPKLEYNVGAAVNTAASAIYSLALDENIYNINDGLAGNALVAEIAVSKIL